MFRGISTELQVSIAALVVLLTGAADRMPQQLEIVPLAEPPIPICPGLFGLNYVWHLVPETVFAAFASTTMQIGASLIRYPGGWAAERYDWKHNSTTGGAAPADGPGVDPETVLRAFPQLSFVTPTLPAIVNPERVGEVAEMTEALARRYGGRVHLWEIGNEWWLQRGAKNNPVMRARNLAAYAALVAKVAPAIKRAAPDAIVFATGEWTHPEDFATLRTDVGPAAWGAVDGFSIHPYCGTLDPETLCSLLPSRAAAIRSAGGKTRLYASEWSLGTRVTADNWGIRNANQMVGAFASLISARLDQAAYWPPMGGSPQIALISTDGGPTATGLLFGWMAAAMRGEMLPMANPTATAARQDGQVALVVPSMATGPVDVTLTLTRLGVSQVLAAEVMGASDPDDPVGSRKAAIVPLPTRITDGVLRFQLNQGSAERSGGWEIARVVLR